jgi:hypothetical protein
VSRVRAAPALAPSTSIVAKSRDALTGLEADAGRDENAGKPEARLYLMPPDRID